MFIHSPGSVNGKQAKWLAPSHILFQPINTLLQDYGREGCHLIGYINNLPPVSISEYVGASEHSKHLYVKDTFVFNCVFIGVMVYS